MTEHWVLYVDHHLQALPWPWPTRDWKTLTVDDVEVLPHSTCDLLRVAPTDGFDALVPENLPREVARCRTHLAVYHDADFIYVFLKADRPAPTPELADLDREDLSCVFQLGGIDRGLYLGLNQNGEHIALRYAFDDSLQLSDAPSCWPFDFSGPISDGYTARAMKCAGFTLGMWRVDRTKLASGFVQKQIRFCATRRCYLTNELVAWASSTLWRPRAGTMGILTLVEHPTPAAKPYVRRLDAIYDTASETAVLRTHWHDLWSQEKMMILRKGTYNEYSSKFSLMLNGQESTEEIKPVVEQQFALADGWNRLEVLCGFSGPQQIPFEKRSGNRIVPGIAKAGLSKPDLPSLRAAFAKWHEVTQKGYHGGGCWGSPTCTNGGYNISHNGAFHAEPYAIAWLHLEQREIYAVRVKEFCERALSMQHRDGWFADLAVEPSGATPFYGGAFDTGSAAFALILGFRVLRDERLLAASRRVVDAYRLYRFETNQNYAAFAVWHLAEHFAVEPSERVLNLAVYYARDAARAIDLGGAQDGHNYYAGYGGITLKGLGKLLAILPRAHPEHDFFRERAIRMANQMVARQQKSGFFAERNRKYVGYQTLTAAVGMLEVAHALGGEIARDLEPAILAAYYAADPHPEGGLLARLGR